MVTLRVIIWHISIYVIYKFPSLSQNKIKTIITSCFTKKCVWREFYFRECFFTIIFSIFLKFRVLVCSSVLG